MNPFSPEEVFLAYKKVKHHFYYDNGNLFEKAKIAEFEDKIFFKNNDENFDVCNNTNINVLKESLQKTLNDFIRDNFFNSDSNLNNFNLINKIEIIKLPKKLKKTKIDIITNKSNINADFEVERYSYFASFPVEVHILSVLWIMFSGRYLNKYIHNSSYANILDMEFVGDNDKPSDNFKLFKPYFVQYQLWRDTAINKAESLIKENRNVAILSLDIKNYYHSVRLNLESIFKKIYAVLNKEEDVLGFGFDKNKAQIINKYFLQIHDAYKKLYQKDKNILNKKDIIDNEFSLPVGLISSGILANYYFKDLDDHIINKINPAFYGRYVDDLMFVFSDVNHFIDRKLNSSILTFINRNFVKKGILKLIPKNENVKKIYFDGENYTDCMTDINEESLKNCFELLDFNEEKRNSYLLENVEIKVDCNQDVYCDRQIEEFNYEYLKIQSSKAVLHYLDHKESKAIINIFKKKLDDQRSEFRFLPDEDEISEKFDEEAFELRYNDSINKFRSISDFSENKYGASKFLAKKIFAKSFGDYELDEESDSQILTFFRGELAIKFYSLWEKVATYFIVSGRLDYLLKFKENVCTAIKHTNFNDHNNSISKCFEKYLTVSISIPLALNPKLINSEGLKKQKNNQDFFEKCHELALKIRRSNLIRHSLLAIPASNLTRILSTDLNLLEKNFNKYVENNNTRTDNDIFKLCKLFCYLAPNYIQFHEVNILRIVDVITNLDESDLCDAKSIKGKFYYLYPEQKKSVLLNLEIPKTNNEIIEKLKNGKIEEISFSKENSVEIKEDNEIELDIISRIPDDAFTLYYFINYSWKRTFKRKYEIDLKKNYFSIDLGSSINSSLQALNINIKGEKIDEKLEKVNKNIAIANIKVNQSDILNSIKGNPNVKKERRKILFDLINEADKNEADLVVFPEVSVPYSWIRLLAERSHKRYMGIVAGLEHWVNKNKIVFNFMVTVLPFKINYYKTSIIKLRLKNHYSHAEKHLIKGYRLLIPNDNTNYTMSYDLFHWQKTYFSVYNCFELADIYHRSLFKSKVDFIIASEYNKDTNYFSDIAGAWVRDVHSYFVQVNSSDFGDSRIIQPSKSETKDLIQIKGGKNSIVLVDNIEIDRLRDFQFKEYHLQKDDIDSKKTVLKPTPPDFDRNNVKIRIENRDF